VATKRSGGQQPGNRLGPAGLLWMAFRPDWATAWQWLRLPDSAIRCYRWAHNPEVAGSNPAPATRLLQVRGLIAGNGGQAFLVDGSTVAARSGLIVRQLVDETGSRCHRDWGSRHRHRHGRCRAWHVVDASRAAPVRPARVGRAHRGAARSLSLGR
jgi:hypothetical protein